MRLAETVTFGGGGIERAAALRGDSAAMDALRQNVKAKFIPFWRGKPLVRQQSPISVAPVQSTADVMKYAAEESFFLGHFDEAPWFVSDVSGWEPEHQETETIGAFFDPSEQRFPGMPDDHHFAELRMIMAQLSPGDAELAATARALLCWHESHRYCARCGAESRPAMAGWQRDCPACGTSHFPRTDPVVIMLVTHGNSLLLGRSPSWPEGMFSLLAGFVEPGETMEGAVRREVMEETGVPVGDVSYLASQPWPFPASLMLGCRAAALSREIRVDPTEIEEALWVSREETLDILAGRHDVIRSPREGAIARFLISNWLADRLD